MSEKLERLNIALDAAGVPIRGRQKVLVEKTGYSSGMVSRLMTGKDTLNERFIRTVCREFGIFDDFIQNGEGEVLRDVLYIKVNQPTDNKIYGKIFEGIARFFYALFPTLDEADLYSLYSDILRCDRLQLVKKNGETITIYQNPDSEQVNK